MGTYERKTREIKRSLHRRARMRRAYFKMIGEDPKKKKDMTERQQIDNGEEINLSDASDSEDESERTGHKAPAEKSQESKPEAEPKLTGRQLARRKRSEEYHRKKEQEEKIAKAQKRRDIQKNTMMKRGARGQPKLGSQVGVLLDKIRKSNV